MFPGFTMSVPFHYRPSTEFQYVNFHVSCDEPVKLIRFYYKIQDVPGTYFTGLY